MRLLLALTALLWAALPLHAYDLRDRMLAGSTTTGQKGVRF